MNILNVLYTLLFFSSKCSSFRNANLFGSCIIHILYTGCAEIKKKYFRRQRVKGPVFEYDCRQTYVIAQCEIYKRSTLLGHAV